MTVKDVTQLHHLLFEITIVAFNVVVPNVVVVFQNVVKFHMLIFWRPLRTTIVCCFGIKREQWFIGWTKTTILLQISFEKKKLCRKLKPHSNTLFLRWTLKRDWIRTREREPKKRRKERFRLSNVGSSVCVCVCACACACACVRKKERERDRNGWRDFKRGEEAEGRLETSK